MNGNLLISFSAYLAGNQISIPYFGLCIYRFASAMISKFENPVLTDVRTAFTALQLK